ncbi:MAG: SDR family oxidoreductase [Clostridiaceae bacterium]|nr:SDR family oxidoreductase [Clostridiaceae bacterium]
MKQGKEAGTAEEKVKAPAGKEAKTAEKKSEIPAGKEAAAIVTGASSGIGKEISRLLCRLGYQVFGFGRTFCLEETAECAAFHPIACDLLDTAETLPKIRRIKKEYRVCILVNNAGVGYYGLHEELKGSQIQEMVRINLELPLLLSNLLLRDLKRESGYIINISSVTAGRANPHGCAYGATKAGLSGFSESLFEEARKYGVKVVTIQPDMTKTDLYRNADFTASEEEMARLLPEEVAAAVEYILNQRTGLVVTELTLRPQLHRIRKKRREN